MNDGITKETKLSQQRNKIKQSAINYKKLVRNYAKNNESSWKIARIEAPIRNKNNRRGWSKVNKRLLPDVRVDASPALERGQLVFWLTHECVEETKGTTLRHSIARIHVDGIKAFVILSRHHHPFLIRELHEGLMVHQGLHSGFRDQNMLFCRDTVPCNFKVCGVGSAYYDTLSWLKMVHGTLI